MARLFVAACAVQPSFSTLMVIGDRRRFGRPGVQFAVLALATAESAWLTRRILTAGRFRDRRGMWVDTVASAAGLAASAVGLGTGDAAPWMKNVAIGSALGASSSEVPVERAAAVGLIAGAALATGIRAKRTRPPRGRLRAGAQRRHQLDRNARRLQPLCGGPPALRATSGRGGGGDAPNRLRRRRSRSSGANSIVWSIRPPSRSSTSSPPATTPRQQERWRVRRPAGSATSCEPRARFPPGSIAALYEMSESVRGRGAQCRARHGRSGRGRP